MAILVGAFGAAIVGLITLLQKRRADDRSEWWRRAQWALDHAAGDNPVTKTLGMDALTVLADSKLAKTDDLQLFDSAWESVKAPRASTPVPVVATNTHSISLGRRAFERLRAIGRQRPVVNIQPADTGSPAPVDTNAQTLDNGDTTTTKEARP